MDRHFRKNSILKIKFFEKKIKFGLLVQYSSPFLERFEQFSTMKNDFENQNFEMFEQVVHNSGKSDDDII